MIKMIIKMSNNKIIADTALLNKRKSLLFCCSLWTILTASGLVFVQTSPLSAMDDDERKRNERKQNSTISQKSKIKRHRPAVELQQNTNPPSTQKPYEKKDSRPAAENPKTGFQKDARKAPTQTFKPKKGLLEESGIEYVVQEIEKKIIEEKKNADDVVIPKLKNYKECFRCSGCINHPPSSSKLPHTPLLYGVDNQNASKPKKGRSGAEVIFVPDKYGNSIVIKKFTNTKEKPHQIEEGLKELLYSLIALRHLNLSKELKVARIDDAILCPKDSFSIIMEKVEGDDISNRLSKYLPKNYSKAKKMITACAKYLAKFHIENYQQNTNRGKYLKHIAKAYSTLVEKHPGEMDNLPSDRSNVKLFALDGGPSRKGELNMKSGEIISLLDKNEQNKFIEFVKETQKNFKDNVTKIYQLLQDSVKKRQYFLSITHGDAHGDNFFYDDKEGDDSFDPLGRITMIDYASIMETYWNIGDPAEDIGRFLGSLWEWFAQTNKCSDEIRDLQKEFFKIYLEEIKNSKIIKEKNQKVFKKIFKDNCNFYKLRFYRVICNSEQSPKIKKTILNSWIEENTQRSSKQKNKPGQSPWVEGNIIHYDLPKGFINSAPKGSKPYLTQLQDIFQTLRIAVVTGMAGIGKTSLALAYAHNPSKAYKFIYWLSGKTDEALIGGYKKLLGDSVANIKDHKDIIEKFNQYISTIQGECLLIYDNVPNYLSFLQFLQREVVKDILPKNADILITSRNRNKGGWNELPFKPEIITLDVFRLNESIDYFKTISGLPKENQAIVTTVAKKLGRLPLALSYAAHYVSLQEKPSNVSEKTFQKYLDAFHKDPRTRNPIEELRPKIIYQNFVQKTLHMSENLISPLEAAELIKILEYAASCDLSSIKAIKEDALSWIEETKLKQALEQLSSLSLIKRTNEAKFSIHPLVWLVVRNEITKDFDQRHNASKLNTRWVIKSVNNGQVLDNFGTMNQPIVGVWEEYRGDRQLWNITRHNQHYIIKSVDKKVNYQVLDNWGAKNKIGLCEEDFSNQYCNTKQLWSIIKHNQGYIIKSVNNKQVLDNWSAEKKQIGLWGEDDSTKQLWLILEK